MNKELTPLEALEKCKYLFISKNKEYAVIETALKALEIIKDSCDVEVIEYIGEFDVPLYYMIIDGDKIRIIAKKDYELLKEVLS